MRVSSLFPLTLLLHDAKSSISVINQNHSLIYNGLERNGIEVFLNIPFGQDTSGSNRFKAPRLFVPERGSIINAQSLGPSCPQQTGKVLGPLALANVTDISEDCLNLNISRPRGYNSDSHLPVMIWIYGGSFWVRTNGEPTTRPDGLVLESMHNGLPVIHVSINYRLGVFRFSQSEALKEETSENAGLRDQILGIEWVRDNIEAFGGDSEKITIHGQSSGGACSNGRDSGSWGHPARTFPIGHLREPANFPSLLKALGYGFTSSIARDATQAVVDYVGCNTTSFDDPETVKCLRSLDMQTLLTAELVTVRGDLGDQWLPAVDGDFWPAAPSELLLDGRFANVTTMIGWTQDDLTLYTDPSIETAQDTYDSVHAGYSGMSADNIVKLLVLYPVADFLPNPVANKPSEFYRAARISRDVFMVCQPISIASTFAAAGNDVFLYKWNQTVVDPALASVRGLYGIGIPHTSEFAYTFGNISVYDVNGYPFEPTPADYALQHRGSRSWPTFASTGKPSLEGHDTFLRWENAFPGDDEEPYVFFVGGSHEGLSALDGPRSAPEVEEQKLRERCAFINSPEVTKQLYF